MTSLRDDILSAAGQPAHSVATVLRPLSKTGGFGARALEILGVHPGFSTCPVDMPQSEPLEKVDDFVARWSQLLSAICELSVCASIVARTLSNAVTTMPVSEQADVWKKISVEFWENFREAAAQLSVGHLFSFAEADDVIASRFATFSGYLPTPSELQATTSSWPHFDTEQPGRTPLQGVPVPLLPLFSEKIAFAFALLPFYGRVLALQNFSVCAGSLRPVAKYLERVYSGTTVFGRERKTVSEYFTPPTCVDGGESNAFRQLRRALSLVTLLSALLKGIQGASDDFFGAHSALATSVFFSQPSQYQGTDAHTAANIINHHMEHFLHVGSAGWVLRPVGSSAISGGPLSASSGNLSSMGMQFLNNQLKDKDSKYRMPLKIAAEKQWEDWFDRVSQLPQLYLGLSAQLIIPALLGHVSAEDGRILGWHEVSREAHAKGETVGLQTFLSHVRKQVLPAGTARKNAAIELQTLSSKPHSIEDCQAISIKIQQLFRQLYPVSSTESEPLTRLNAMKLVHSMMNNLKRTASHHKSKAAAGWKEYTAYNHSELFSRYLDESLHSSSFSSVDLCTCLYRGTLVYT